MRILGAMAAAVWSLAVSPTIAADSDPINALWNDTEGFGIWLYARPGSCAEFGYEKPPFIVIGPGGVHPKGESAEISAASLPACLLIENGIKALCDQGTIRYRFDPNKNEYRGKYDLRLTNGERRSGEFRAEHCKWK